MKRKYKPINKETSVKSDLESALFSIDQAIGSLRAAANKIHKNEVQNFIDSAGSYLVNANADIEYIYKYIGDKKE